MNKRVFAGIASLGALLVLPACNRSPESVVRLQGTVKSIGYDRPVKAADVVVEWPRELGGGTSTLKTDADGHYAIGRTVHARTFSCKGIVITVRAAGFASAYSQSDDECVDSRLTADFRIFPTPR
jgi:hypothetical protein